MNMMTGENAYCRVCEAERGLGEFAWQGLSLWACSECGLGLILRPSPADSTIASMAPLPEAMSWMSTMDPDAGAFPTNGGADRQDLASSFSPRQVAEPVPGNDAADRTTVQPLIIADHAPHPTGLAAADHTMSDDEDESTASLNASFAGSLIAPTPITIEHETSRHRAEPGGAQTKQRVDPASLYDSGSKEASAHAVAILDSASELTDAVLRGLNTQGDLSELEAHHRVPQFIQWYVKQVKSGIEPSLVVMDQFLGVMSGLEVVFCLRAVETALEVKPVPIILFVDKGERAQLAIESAGLDQLRLVSRGPRTDRLAHAKRVINVVGRILN